jgi:hypothetical protein
MTHWTTATSYIPTDADRARVGKMIDAILRAILDESPALPGSAKKEVTGNRMTTEVTRELRFDAPLMAMAYLTAAIGIQSKAVENRIATKAFVRMMADLIENDIKAMRESGDEMPFAVTEMWREDQRH